MSQKPYIVEKENVWKAPAIIAALALGAPVGYLLFRAVMSIPVKTLQTFGTILVGVILLIVIVAAGILFMKWVAQPGQQLPNAFRGLERTLEK